MDSVVETFPFPRVMHVRSHPGPIVDASIGGGHYPSSRSIGRAQSRKSALMMHEAIYPHSTGETPLLLFVGSEIFMYDRYVPIHLSTDAWHIRQDSVLGRRYGNSVRRLARRICHMVVCSHPALNPVPDTTLATVRRTWGPT